MPLPSISLKSVAGAIASRKDTTLARKRLKKRVLKGTDALTCCEQAHLGAIGKVQSICNDLVEALGAAKRGHALALVPVSGAPGLVRIITISEAAATGAAGAALGVITILLPAVELGHLAEQKGAYDAIGIIGNAIAQLQRRKSDCENCIEKRTLSQSHPRERMRVKINRRI